MKPINELESILKLNLGWHQPRIHCLARVILALIKVRSVNLMEIACAFGGQAQMASNYRRLQRFFSGFEWDFDQVAIFIFKLFFSMTHST